MRKFLKVLSVTICLVLGGLLINNHYENLKEKRFNNIINNATLAVENKEYKIAELLLDKARIMSYKKNGASKKIQNLEFKKSQQELYDKGLRFERMKMYKEAIDTFCEIEDGSNNLKKDSEKEIKFCKKNIIDNLSRMADKAIEKGDIEDAKYIIVKIERIDSKSPEIDILNMKIKGFKQAK